MIEPTRSTFAAAAESALNEMLAELPPASELPDDYIELFAAHCDETAGKDIVRRCLYYGILGVAMQRLKQNEANNKGRE